MIKFIIIICIFPILLRYGLAYLFFRTVVKESGQSDCGITGGEIASKLKITGRLPKKLQLTRNVDGLAEIYTRAAVDKIRSDMPEQAGLVMHHLKLQAIALPLSLVVAVFAILTGKNLLVVLACLMSFHAIIAVSKFTTLNLSRHIASQAIALLKKYPVPRQQDEDKIALCIQARVWR